MSIFDSPLIKDQTCDCCFLNKAIVLDDVGGYDTKWTEGATFEAVITENSSLEATIAGIAQERTYYGVKVRSAVPLEFHGVFKRVTDNKIFRITTAEGLNAPSISALGMKQLQAEEFELQGTVTVPTTNNGGDGNGNG